MKQLLYALYDSLGELFAGAVTISLAALLLLPDWRARPQYVLAGWLVGPLVGVIVLRFGGGPGLALLASSIGSITAPATVAWLHNKSAAQVAQELLDLRRELHGGKRRDDEKGENGD